MNKGTARIDGDLCTFAVSSACEGKRYKYKGTEYDSKLELNKILKRDGVDDSSVEFYKVPEQWEDVKTSAISYLENIIEKVDTDYQIYLSGKSNFRYDIATILPYKGNRSSIDRPVHLDAVRQLYVDLYDARVSIGMEADDAIGIDHNEEAGDIIVSRDKDLDCIPGMHFDWNKDLNYTISVVQADRCFYKQVLIGDSTDNILGLYGVGKDSLYVKQLQQMETDKEMFDHVKDQYEKRFGSYWKKFMLENCQLLWIKQKRKEVWEDYIA